MVIRVVENMKFHGRDSARSPLIGQTILLFGLIIVVQIFINITFQGQICNAVTETPTTKCDHSFNYTEGSTFESNLQRVFNSLIEGANPTGFNISVYGQSPDRIYGLFQCREDMTVDQCYICSQLAITSIMAGEGPASRVGPLVSITGFGVNMTGKMTIKRHSLQGKGTEFRNRFVTTCLSRAQSHAL